MVDILPILSREQRHHLIEALKRIPLFQTQEGRTLLLTDLPITGLSRSTTLDVDLFNIVDAVVRWGKLPDATSPLLMLLDNAREYAGNGEAGRELAVLYQELIQTLRDSPPVANVVDSTITPLERAERYRAFKEAATEYNWQSMRRLSVGIEGYKDVLDLLNRPAHLLEEVIDAFEASNWAQLIRVARQLGAEAPPNVAEWVTRAWREVPITEMVLRGHINSVLTVTITPDGRQALSGSSDRTLRLWDLTTGQELHTFKGHTGQVWAGAVTTDGLVALSSSGDETLRLWNLATGQEVHTFNNHEGSSRAVALTPNGLHALSGSGDGTLQLWHLVTGQELRTFTGHTREILAIAVTPDGRQVLSGSADKTLRLWDLDGNYGEKKRASTRKLMTATNRALRTFTGHTSAVPTVVVTPDGRQALSGSLDSTLRLWNLATGQEMHTFSGHEGMVRAVAVTPDGRQALSGSQDKTLRLWNLATGQQLRTLIGHEGPVFAVAISPDGRTIVSSGGDNTVRVWTLPEGLLG